MRCGELYGCPVCRCCVGRGGATSPTSIKQENERTGAYWLPCETPPLFPRSCLNFSVNAVANFRPFHRGGLVSCGRSTPLIQARMIAAYAHGHARRTVPRGHRSRAVGGVRCTDAARAAASPVLFPALLTDTLEIRGPAPGARR